MTRLDSAIRRLTAQRDLLDWAARNISPAGLVLEIGLAGLLHELLGAGHVPRLLG